MKTYRKKLSNKKRTFSRKKNQKAGNKYSNNTNLNRLHELNKNTEKTELKNKINGIYNDFKELIKKLIKDEPDSDVDTIIEYFALLSVFHDTDDVDDVHIKIFLKKISELGNDIVVPSPTDVTSSPPDNDDDD